MLNFLQKLITFDTTQIENQAIEFIEGYVRNIYWDQLIYEKQDISDKWRYNLIIKNTNKPDVILAWHVDVVPELSKEQFIPRIDWNKLYGRGAVDMKAGVAINIALIDFMLKNKIKFWILSYTDEEYNFLGMKKFVEVYGWKIKPKLTIVTEPTNKIIYTWFRWIAVVNLQIGWVSVHSALKHLGINAIEEYIHYIENLEEYIQTKDSDWYVSLTNLAGIHWGIDKDWIIVSQANIVPNTAKWIFSLRLWNMLSYQEFESFTRNYLDKNWIKIISLEKKNWCYPLIQSDLLNKYSKYSKVESGLTFWYSDVQLIKEYIGWDCLLIWPWPFEKAHQIDEYVEIESIYQSKEIIEKILKDFA